MFVWYVKPLVRCLSPRRDLKGPCQITVRLSMTHLNFKPPRFVLFFIQQGAMCFGLRLGTHTGSLLFKEPQWMLQGSISVPPTARLKPLIASAYTPMAIFYFRNSKMFIIMLILSHTFKVLEWRHFPDELFKKTYLSASQDLLSLMRWTVHLVKLNVL